MFRLAWFALFLGLLSLPVFGQFETSEVVGTVRDPSGAFVSSAKVTLTNQNTGVEATANTDSNGNFDFFNVKVGRYTVTVEHPGFTKFNTSDVQVDVNARQRVDVTLQVGAVTESVNVTGAASALETDSSEHSQVISTQQVVELPLNGRNYADLALLSTNTIKSPMAASFSPSGTPREGAFNVNGMRSTYNNFLLDGLDNNMYGTSNQGYSAQTVQPSPDAIAEFQVITSNYSAEYGRVGGAVINAALKSGTNQIHGSAGEFLRNTVLNADGFQFTPLLYKPTLQRNQFGAALGGPFIKNKLFWFVDYEGYRQLQDYLNYDSLPSTLDRQGILPAAVQDPLTGKIYPAGTQIPIAQLNPFAAYVLSNLPPVNAGSATSRASNDEALLLIKDYSDKFDAKIDDQINDKMTAFLRVSQRKDLQYFAPDLTGPAGGDGNGYIHTLDQNASIGYTWAVSSSSIFEARFGFTHVLAGKEPPYLGGPSMASMFGGFAGLPTSSNLTGGINTQTITGFGTSSLGRQTSNPQFQNPTNFGPKLNFSKVVGRHSLKMGYELDIIRTEVLDVNPLYGQDTYASAFSCPPSLATCPNTANATTYDLADFIFGTPSAVNLGNNFVSNLRQHVNALYLQDDWNVTRKLTVNVGLRWEYATPLVDRDNNWSNFDPTTDTMIRATGGSLYDRALVHPNYKDFEPRLGLAYSVDSKTVVRAGYGISYDFFNRVGSAIEGINAPEALFGVFTQSMPYGGPAPASFLTTQNSFSTGIANPANFNPLLSNVDYIPANSPWPYIQTWFLSVQRQIGWGTMLEVAYNGNHSLNLPIIADYNEATPNAPGGTLIYQQRAPVPTFGPITWVDPAGNDHYNGLSARVEHRFAGGLYFLNSFTWGSSIGDSEQALEYYSGYVEANPQNIHNLGAEAGPSSFNAKFNNVTSVVYDVPFGKGRKYGANMNPVLNGILGGWELNTINTAHTGLPLNVYYTPSSAAAVSGLSNDYRGEPFLRPNVSGSSVSQSKGQLVNNYFDGYTFSTPPITNPFGNLSRNAFTAPNFEQWDFSANKFFTIHERARLQFRSEFFNVTNHTNLGIPNTTTTSSSFGQIRTTFPARQIQFALKILF
jgi:hypothetical protein